MFIGTGLFHHGSTELRFLVMERFGKDVDKLFTSSGRKFDVATVLMLGLRVVSHMLFSFQNFLKWIYGETTNTVFIVMQKFMILQNVSLR